MIKKYLIFMLYITVGACTRELPLDVQQQDALPVMVSFINPDSVLTVRLHFTSLISDSSTQAIKNARVTVYENENWLTDLSHVTQGKYASKNFYPKVGSKYRIECDIPDYGTISGMDSIPVFNTDLRANYYSQAYTDEYGDFLPALRMTIVDLNREKADYYDFLVINKQRSGDGKHSYRSLIERADPIITAEGMLDYAPLTVTLQDRLFENNKADLEIVYASGVYRDSTRYFSTTAINEEGNYLIYRKLSSNYYTFLKSWYRHLHNQATDNRIGYYRTLLFSEEPLELYSNVENGLGIVAAYQNRIIKLD